MSSKQQMSHERCSELLLAYAGDELGKSDAAEVATHLRTCAECRSELAGLTALISPEAEGLTEAERARLHHGIEAALASRRAAAPIVSLESRRRWRWGRQAVQAVGVAAALVVIAVGVGSLISNESEPGEGGIAADGGADEGLADLPGPRPRFLQRALAAAPSAAEGGGGGQARTEKDQSFLSENDDVSRRGTIGALGRSRLLDRFANSYTAAEAAEHGPALIDALASAAGDARAEVAECATSVTEESGVPIVPVFGYFTRFEGDRALVIAFVYSSEDAGKLDRYTIWVWRRGSCDTPVNSAFGSVR